MATQTQTKTGSQQSLDLEQKAQKLRQLYADATDIAKSALENVIRALKSGAPAKEPAAPVGTAGRIGRRQGKVSELTVIAPLAPGGAKRLRAFLEILHGSIGNEMVDRVGTVHDMRFVILDNDTKLLFAPPTTATGTSTSRTSRRRSPTSSTCSSAMSKVGQGFVARRSKTSSQATRSRRSSGTSPIRN